MYDPTKDPETESETYFPAEINGWTMAWTETNGELVWYAKRGREYRDGIIEEGPYAYLPEELEEIVAYQLTDPLTVRDLMLLADQAEQIHWKLSHTSASYHPVAEATRQINAGVAP